MVSSSRPRKLYVSYLRVSTDRQGQSGLGLDAQRTLVKDFCGDDWPPVAEFVEVESGKDNDRPQLALALAECRRRKATLVIANLDRLGRRLSFIAGLMDEDVPFVAADMPHADRFRLHLEAVIAEDERRRISERTKAALAAAKARGTKLGGFRGYSIPVEVAAEGRRVRSEKADKEAQALAPVLHQLQAGGITSAHGLARALNEKGVFAPRGGRWQAAQVLRVLQRLR
jgi:DNA invertase Pin-like site-specific DNA recombinase